MKVDLETSERLDGQAFVDPPEGSISAVYKTDII